jgi:hypothetical protein
MKIIQVNIGRSSSAHDLLLSFKADIILVQEPWIDAANHCIKTYL